MVSMTTRVLASSVLAVGIALTLHFILKKTRKKKDKTEPKDKGLGDHSEDQNKNKGDSFQHEHKIHGKRKHPNDEFANVDIQSPKKPHETNNGLVAKDQTEAFESFRKELRNFLNEGSGGDSNTNQNARRTGDSHTEGKQTISKETSGKTLSVWKEKEKQVNGEAREIITTVSDNTQLSESAESLKPQKASNVSAENKAPLSDQTSNASGESPVSSQSDKAEVSEVRPKSSDLVENDSYNRFTEDEITDALLVSQTSPGLLSGPNAEVLSLLLTHPDPKMKETALNGINRCSTFTRNQNLFREHGCLPRLSNLLYQQRMSRSANPRIVTSVANAITNLSANEENQKKLEDCVKTLVDLTLEDETGESVCLSSLQALTNLSITNHHHGHYTRVVQRLYDLVDNDAPSIRLQAAKVLVNLSCNPDLVPNMLAAKAPSCLNELLKPATNEDLLLRWTTLLANILTTVKEQKITSASLPADDKAPSPETMYTALYGVNSGQLKSKVYLLSRHKNENISHQASKVYQVITKM